MGADRVTSKYRSPSRAKEYFADEPGSQYEGMATKKLKELKAGKYYKDRPLGVGGIAGGPPTGLTTQGLRKKVKDQKAEGGRAGYKFGSGRSALKRVVKRWHEQKEKKRLST